MRQIDKQPPVRTGNAEKDLQAMYDYVAYMRDQMNYIIQLLDRKIGG